MRPSKNTDKQLMQAAKELLIEKGSMDIGMREVAARAGVNMGMFYYHFKDKEDFWAKILQEFYEEFFMELKLDASLSDSPIENLRSVLIYIGQFAANHRPLVGALFIAAVNGDEVARKFFKKNFVRHTRLIIELVKKGQKQGQLRSTSPFTILTMMMGALNAPTFAYHAMAKGPLGTAKLRAIGATRESVAGEEAIEERVSIIMSAFEKRDRK